MVTQVRGRSSGVVATLIAVLLASGLIFVATKGLLYAVVAVVLAAYLAFVVAFGSRVTGIACMMAAFATAPAYRGLEQMIGGIPPCDAFVIIGVIHLLPTFVGNKLKLPTVYLSGLLIMSVMSLVSVIVTGDLLINAFYAVQWLFFIGVLPILVAWWRPELKAINLMLWSYLGGHLISTAYAFVEGPIHAGRYDGLTHHPNAFGLAGLTSIVIVLYFVPIYRGFFVRVVLLGFVATSLLSIVISGSRASIIVLVVIVLLVPLVERSAVTGFAWVGLGALGVLSIPYIIDIFGEESAIGRLAGSGTASASDAVRTEGLKVGFDRLWSSPIVGSGFNKVEEFHNVFLEAAIAVGFIGLIGYLMVLYKLARPLFSAHPLRRLSYMVWVYMGVGPTFPGLWDRTVWVPASLAALAMLAPYVRKKHDAPADLVVEPAREAVPRAVSPGRA